MPSTDPSSGQRALRFTVRAASRLHFGLMEICPGEPHCFGGIGLMIDAPSLVASATWNPVPSDHPALIDADPYWTPRIEQVLAAWPTITPHPREHLKRLTLVHPLEPHIGLGSGTQTACTVATLLRLASERDAGAMAPLPIAGAPEGGVTEGGVTEIWQNSEALRRGCGRGRRSHVGMVGFLRGGFIVDRGTSGSANDSGNEPSRCDSHPFPRAWRMVIACDRSYSGENGAEEAATIAACASGPNPHRAEMLRRVDQELLPALISHDWERASLALGQYGRLAGEVFRAVQGGIYRSPQVAQTIDQLQRWDVKGAGQSSWGPTVYALARDDEHADWITGRLRGHMPSGTSIRVARGAGPATYSVLESSSSPS